MAAVDMFLKLDAREVDDKHKDESSLSGRGAWRSKAPHAGGGGAGGLRAGFDHYALCRQGLRTTCSSSARRASIKDGNHDRPQGE